jgi:hypothetical protein
LDSSEPEGGSCEHFAFHKIARSPCVAKKLSASQEGLCSKEFGRWLLKREKVTWERR